MINKAELREGNVITDRWASKYNMWPIRELQKNRCIYGKSLSAKYEDLMPVPLSLEILIELGFSQHHGDCSNGIIYIKNIHSEPPYKWGFYPNELGSGIEIKNAIELYYVHQVQNIVFFNTGIELKKSQ